jgi:hypothetical protein
MSTNSGSPRSARVRVARGVYRDTRGFSVIARVGSGANTRSSKEQRFPLSTPLAVLVAHWQREKAVLTDAVPKLTPADVRALRAILDSLAAGVAQVQAILAECVA